MAENLVCQKCGKHFNDRQELQEHARQCTGAGAQQSGKDRPMTRSAGSGQKPTE